jgi:long-chain acyl-CoA synthetase
MATFIPPTIDGQVLFLKGHNPHEIVRQIERRRVSVLVCVPKILEVLRDYVIRHAPEAAQPMPVQPAGKFGFLKRWRHYRRVHRLLGWKFWAFVVGAAPLDPELEEFWKRMGYVVIQGYGLTETAPIVSLNHPFHTQTGSVGKPIAGVEVKVAEDGEILVRGDNVTQGYYGGEAGAFDAEGWFHTGDIGVMDAEGRLSIRGRKKEMIVTPEGLNVFPEDVEKVLNAIAGVKESAVVGVAAGKEERPHAVLVVEGADPAAVIREANRHLEPHQHVRTFSVWTGDAPLPRTEGTRKLKRRAIREWVESGATTPPAPAAGDELAALLAPYSRGRVVTGSTSIEELGLSSLDRVQLLMALEEKLGKPLDERAFTAARTIEELKSLPAAEEEEGPVEFERWSRTRWAYWVRRLNLGLWILPLARVFLWVRRRGLENLEGLEGPVIFASNHQSYFDVPSVLLALPPKWRYRVAPAMRKEFFAAKWEPEKFGRWQWFRKTLSYNLSALMLNAFPLPQRSAGTKEALRYAGELSSEGWHILLFPEGKHSRDETIAPFAPGVAMMAARLGIPVVPVRVRGVNRVLHPDWRMARPGFVTVTVGKPLRLTGSDYPELAREVEKAVREL